MSCFVELFLSIGEMFAIRCYFCFRIGVFSSVFSDFVFVKILNSKFCFGIGSGLESFFGRRGREGFYFFFSLRAFLFFGEYKFVRFRVGFRESGFVFGVIAIF